MWFAFMGLFASEWGEADPGSRWLTHEGATNRDSALGPSAVGSARPRVFINDAH